MLPVLITMQAVIILLFFPDDSSILPTVSVGTFVIVLGLPFLGVGGVSLYSKITDERTQGMQQSF